MNDKETDTNCPHCGKSDTPNHCCGWKHDGERNYDTDCFGRFTLITGTPKQNKMDYCPYCTGRIVVEEKGDE